MILVGLRIVFFACLAAAAGVVTAIAYRIQFSFVVNARETVAKVVNVAPPKLVHSSTGGRRPHPTSKTVYPHLLLHDAGRSTIDLDQAYPLGTEFKGFYDPVLDALRLESHAPSWGDLVWTPVVLFPLVTLAGIWLVVDDIRRILRYRRQTSAIGNRDRAGQLGAAPDERPQAGARG